jgi:hypothetical protein
MGKLKVKNGTPVGDVHLCRNCSNGQFTLGYRESEVLVLCTNSSPALRVPFPVYECTGYWDRNRPGYDEMTKLALDFSHGRRKAITGFRNSGFAQIPAVAESEPEDVEDEAAINR